MGRNDGSSKELVVEVVEDLLLDETTNGDDKEAVVEEEKLSKDGALLLDTTELVATWLELFEGATKDKPGVMLDISPLARVGNIIEAATRFLCVHLQLENDFKLPNALVAIFLGFPQYHSHIKIIRINSRLSPSPPGPLYWATAT